MEKFRYSNAESAEWLRDDELSKRSGLGKNLARKIAEESGSVCKVGKTRITNWKKFNAYLQKEYAI